MARARRQTVRCGQAAAGESVDEPPGRPTGAISMDVPTVDVEDVSSRAVNTPAGEMLFLSDLTGAVLRDPSGRVIARVKDLVALVLENAPAPVLHGLVARAGGSDLHFVPWRDVKTVEPGTVGLASELIDPGLFERRPGEMLLAKDLRDMEVVHVDGKRVVRVNDVALQRLDDQWIVAGIDASAAALLAQVGLSWIARGRLRREILPWNEIEIFEDGLPMPLHLSHDKIARLHPSDIAKVFHGLGYRQSSELLEDLPNEVAADVVEDLAPEYQATLLSSMNRDRAADILEEMPPDAAADVLNDIVEEDPEAAEELVQSMDSDDAAVVEKLRSYPDDTAGGLMTPDFVMLPASTTAGQAIQTLRAEQEALPPEIDPIFVVAEPGSRRLVGVVNLQTLVLAPPEERLESIMTTELVVRHVDDPAREVVKTIAHYNLAALPILDEREDLVGVVPINEAMDLILPREWLPRMTRPFIGGHSGG